MKWWQQRKSLRLALMVSHVVFTVVQVDWVPTSCSTHLDLWWKVAPSPPILLRAGPFSFPNLQPLMTMVLLWGHLMHCARWVLCNSDCKILTTAICFSLHRYSIRCIHPAHRCLSSRQMTDDIFEVETTALAYSACATRDSGILLTDFACGVSSCQSPLDLPRSRQGRIAQVHSTTPAHDLQPIVWQTLNSQEKPKDNFSWPQVSDKIVFQEAFSLQWHSILYFDGLTARLFPGTLLIQSCNVCFCRWFCRRSSILSLVDACFVPCVYGSGQYRLLEP